MLSLFRLHQSRRLWERLWRAGGLCRNNQTEISDTANTANQSNKTLDRWREKGKEGEGEGEGGREKGKEGEIKKYKAPTNFCTRSKKPAGLEGKNWRDLRKKQRFGHDHWQPMKRLTHEQMDHLRNLRQMQPKEWTNKKLSEKFGISIPSVARILKSKFEAPPEVRARQDAKAHQQRDERREKLYQELNTTTKDRHQVDKHKEVDDVLS